MEQLKTWIFWCLSAGFLGSVASAMGMGVARVWEQDTVYRLFASGAVIFGIMFVSSFVLGLLFASVKTDDESTENEAEPTENV